MRHDTSAKENAFVLLHTEEQVYEVLTEFQDCLKSLQRSDAFRRAMSQKFSKNALVYVLKEGADHVGFAAFYANNTDTRIAFISMIAVKEESRGRHYGSTLMEKVSLTAVENGMRWMQLEVQRSNTAAISFYQKHGFVMIGEKSADSYLMSKELTNTE